MQAQIVVVQGQTQLLMQIITAVPWGFASDWLGRRPVIIFGNVVRLLTAKCYLPFRCRNCSHATALALPWTSCRIYACPFASTQSLATG
jgi:MFS family permease